MTMNPLPDPGDAYREAERLFGVRTTPAPMMGTEPTLALCAADWAIIRALTKEGLSPAEIATRTGVELAEVDRVAASLKDSREAAREILQSNAHTFAQRVVTEADVDQSLEMLDRLGVAEKRRDDKASSVQINFGIQY
jgi:hypothetical protein